MADDKAMSITLTHDQALVLFDWLGREDEKQSIPIAHQSEQDVLWAIEA